MSLSALSVILWVALLGGFLGRALEHYRHGKPSD